MLIKRFTLGFVNANCYLIACKKTLNAMVIDPGFRKGEEKDVLREISKQQLQVKYVVSTHGHPDHTMGNGILKQATGAEILIHENDARWLTHPYEMWWKITGFQQVPPFVTIPSPCPACGEEGIVLKNPERKGKIVLSCSKCSFVEEILPITPADRLLHHGEDLQVGQLEFEVIHTPGHSRGSVSLYCQSENVVFTGDTLLAGSIGEYHMPVDASYEDIMHSLKERLMKLPDNTIVYPGHREQTTIGKEKRENPELQDIKPS